MSLWSPDTQSFSHETLTQLPSQSGIALVVALIILLVLTAMGAGIAYVTSVQSDLVASVINKPLSIDAGETCFDNAIEWLSTSDGRGWLNGAQQNEVKKLADKGGPLYGKTILLDTAPIGSGDLRESKFQERVKRASYSTCDIQMIDPQTDLNIGSEIGTASAYGARSFQYVVSIAAVGVVGNGFSTSSKSAIEVVLQYIP